VLNIARGSSIRVHNQVSSTEQIFATLADRHSINIVKMAYFGFKGTSKSIKGNISEKQFYSRLKRLRDIGIIEKRNSVYRTTTFGSLIYNGQIKALEDIIVNYWNLKAVDVLKSRQDFPLSEKEKLIEEMIQNTSLKSIVNGTHLSGFSIIKDYNKIILEVTRLLESAEKEVYMATRYYDPHFSKLMFHKIANEGLMMHLLDGLPDQISVENRLNAILRVPPNRVTFEMVNKIIKSQRLELRKAKLSASFMVVDGTTVCYEATDYLNPEQFSLAISHYDDPYLAQRFISHYHTLAKDAKVPQFIEPFRKNRA
jgi:predicted transcriptional regulator